MRKCMTEDEFQVIKLQDDGDLVEKLYSYLQDKRYFVVLDDVWRVDHWNTVSPAFPTGKKGSKILLTTRNREVASQVDPWSLHFEPQMLSNDESWELLCAKAFPKDMAADIDSNPAALEKLGRKMVSKCGGLPLAICVLGGILATKKSEVKQWELVHRDVIAYINKSENGGVNGILALSYHDLPSHLKPCFLFLGMFPEDYTIPRRQLIQFWIAEGFIAHRKEVTLEDIGKHQYLAELVQRCMVQSSKDVCPSEWGKVEICRMHDLMRDLCLSKAKEINFLDIYNKPHQTGNVITSASVSTGADSRRLRRYTIYLENDSVPRYVTSHFNDSDSALRTILALVPWGISIPLNYQKIKLLRVLDLGNVKFSNHITKEVSKLIHLRYLALGDLSGYPVSSSISNLRNLQFLMITSFEGTLPETTSKLVHLRHLRFGSGTVGQKFRIENLVNLQTIYTIKAGNWIRKGCLDKILHLRGLTVSSASRLQTETFLDEVVKMRSSTSSSSSDYQYQNPLRALTLYCTETFPSLIFDSLSCCHNLHVLKLFGRLDVLKLNKYPPNLSKLHFADSMLEEDPMGSLQYLPNLRRLYLWERVYLGEEMVCTSDGFPKLECLVLDSREVKEWRVNQGGMPRLKELHIRSCTKLSMLPEGLRFITTLQELTVKGTPVIRDRIVEGVGEDWYKVQHVPSITTTR